MRKILSAKKGQVDTLPGAIIALVLAGTILILGMVLLQELRDADAVQTDDSINDTSREAANSTLMGLAQFSDFWEIIVIAIVVTVVIGLLLAGFGRRMR